MTPLPLECTDRDLREVAAALRSGRLKAPYSAETVSRFASKNSVSQIASTLERFASMQFSDEQIAAALDLIHADRQARPQFERNIELVVTGPDIPGTPSRDTGVVVRELFAGVTESVLVVGFAVFQGQRVFQALADRMEESPSLKVRLLLDVQRGQGETSSDSEIVARFAARFKQTQWPKQRPLPRLFFDPRSLDHDNDKRACLHAKVVVVDRRSVLISSANFTEAAQQRNIEMGVVLDSPYIASHVVAYFDALINEGHLQLIIL